MLVLITGAAGFIAPVVTKDLCKSHRLRLVDIVDVKEPIGEVFKGSVTDYAFVDRAMQGVDAIVHMARAPHLPMVPRPTRAHHLKDLEMNFEVNVGGTYNVCRAAFDYKVRRLVYTSTHAVWVHNPGYEVIPSQGGLVTTEEIEPTPRPEYPYALTKYLGEKVVEVFAKAGLPSIILRLGQVTATWLDRKSMERNMVHISDVSQAVRLALENETVRFDVFNIFGAFKETNYPIEKARRILGYTPRYGDV
jgi:nucleoside-diphosphate-sugar epimerase